VSLAAAISRPRSVERGVSTTLTLTITDTLTGTVQTPSAATVQILDGATEILAATAAAATIPDSIRLTDQWLEIWTLTIGGVAYTFRATGYLCRHAYHPTLTDSDLTTLHPDLTSQRPPGLTTYGGFIDEAQGWIERKLLQKGRRPELIFDAWALRDAHLYYSLTLIFRAFASSLGRGRYAEEATRYETMAHDELRAVKFRYDTAQTGTVDSPAQEAQSGPLVLTAAPRNRWGRSW